MAEEVVDLTQDDNGDQELQFWIPMCPIAKPSVSYGPGRGGPKGWFRMHINNDVRKKMNELKQIARIEARKAGFQLLKRTQPVSVTAWFFLKRPDSDFISRIRSRGLTEKAKKEEATMVAIKPDTDNLTKFLLDAMTGALFEDDAQVVEMHLFKLRDSNGHCLGRMAVQVGPCKMAASQIIPGF